MCDMQTEQPIPSTLQALREQSLAPFRRMPPEEALQRLKDMGYTPDTWDNLLSSGDRSLGSHEVRLLIIRAKGEDFV